MIVSYIVDYQATIKKKRFIKQPFVSSFFLYQDHSDKILNITVDGQEYSIFLPIYLTEEEIELEMLNLMWGNSNYNYQIFSVERKHII
jgi:hypothetical protein